MKKRLLAVCVILGLLGTLPVSAAAEQVWAGREMLCPGTGYADMPVSYTHLRAHET